MAKLTMTRIRAFIGGVFALILVLLLLSVGTAMFGYDLPVLGTIARTLGVEPADNLSDEISTN
jgi:hypothetical protein